MTGRKLGNYDVQDKLGEGGMGEVWRARDARLNRNVAVKILPADVAADPGRRLRFEQEAQALGALNHPNIVAVYDVGQSDGQAYIVSELVDGESLRKVIDRGPLPVRKIIEISTQTAEGIAAAHALGIIHRDLKPENVMVTRDGRAKVLDFGLAKQQTPKGGDDTATIAMSQPGMVLGTVGYMSPEQVRGEPVDARSDIFSFGCVLYELATGSRAFQGKSAADVMSAILREEPREVTAFNAALPQAIDSIVRRCLEKDPARRFQSAADLAFALRSVSNFSTSHPAAPATRPRSLKWLLPAVAALGAVVLFATGYLVHAGTAKTVIPQFHRLTFREGRVAAARFSPDGQNVIYAAAWDSGPYRLYFGTPGSPEARDLGTPASAELLSVSSKGDLAILTGPFDPDGAGTLSRTSLGGEQSRGLLENVLYADWSPDGSELAIVRKVDNENRLEYPIGKVLVKSKWILPPIRVSPDGKRVAFSHYENGSAVRIDTVDRDATVHKIGVVSGQTSGGGYPPLNWSRDGREIWFRSFDEVARNTIIAADMNGKTRVVARFPSRISLEDIGTDGRLLISSSSGRMGIRVVAPGETAERDLSCLESSLLRSITPDGRIILVNIVGESGGPKGSIYWRLTDGSPMVRLGDGFSFGISPDGKWVTGYNSRDTTKRTFVLMPTGPGEEIPTHIATWGPGGGIVVGFLPGDGNYLAMGFPKGKRQYFVWNRPANTVRAVSPEGVEDGIPLLSLDSKRFAAPGAVGWIACDIASGNCNPIPGLTAHDQPIGWNQDGTSLYVGMHHDENRMFMVSLVNAATGQRTPWKHIEPAIPADSVSNLKITPNGGAWAYNYSTSRSNLFLADGIR